MLPSCHNLVDKEALSVEQKQSWGVPRNDATKMTKGDEHNLISLQSHCAGSETKVSDAMSSSMGQQSPLPQPIDVPMVSHQTC